MDKETYLATNECLNINFVRKGKSYRVYVDTELGLISTYEIFETKNDKLINLYDFETNRNIGTEYMTTGDYCKIYDMLVCTKEEFLNSYSYIDNDSYEMSLEIAMNPSYLAELMRKAENLLIMENNGDDERFEYMQENGTDYLSSDLWKSVIVNFVKNHYDIMAKREFEEICNSMAC